MFCGDYRYDVLYYSVKHGTDMLWLRTPSLIKMIRAVIHLQHANNCVTVRIRNVAKDMYRR